MTRNNKVVALMDEVEFDPYNSKHRSMFRKLLVSDRTECDIKFNTEGFDSVKDMMLHKMALAGARVLDSQRWAQTSEGIIKILRKCGP